MSYRTPPSTLPSLRDVEQMRAVAFVRSLVHSETGPHFFEGLYRFEVRETEAEQAARDRAAAAPCPVFASGPCLRRWYIPPPPKGVGRFPPVSVPE